MQDRQATGEHPAAFSCVPALFLGGREQAHSVCVRLTLTRRWFQSSTSRRVQQSTMAVVCSGEGSFANWGP